MKFPDSVTVAQLDLFDEAIDVRSPAEYAEDHIPDAINCPVLDDAERAEIGTLYQQVSPFDAKRRGAARVARNIAHHLEQSFGTRGREWRPLIYCWRGGKRSGAMTHVLREIGWQAAQLEGGYKAYRRQVVTQLDALPVTLRFCVVCGETGSAKSRVLAALAEHGEQVLDLEALACHRGSVLGAWPHEPQPAQKAFETRIWHALRSFAPSSAVFVEAESKKIGELQVPEALIAAMRASLCVRIEASVEARVGFLLDEYGHFLATPADLKAKLDALSNLYGKEIVAAWGALVDQQAWRALVTDLLVNHYDPAYHRSMGRNYAGMERALKVTPRELSAEGIRDAAAEIARISALEAALV